VKYTKSHYPIILIKGMLMGIADLIPGVSGGTIALITGIYKDLISSLNNINFKNISKNIFTNFKSHKFDFLSVLVIGIGLSIILFSNIIPIKIIEFMKINKGFLLCTGSLKIFTFFLSTNFSNSPPLVTINDSQLFSGK